MDLCFIVLVRNNKKRIYLDKKVYFSQIRQNTLRCLCSEMVLTKKHLASDRDVTPPWC